MPVQDELPPANFVSLRLANGPLAGPVLCRVISMILTRASCPMNRLNDAMIICDALSAHASTYANDGHVAFTASTDREGIELRVGELAEQGATRLLADAAVPGVGNVLERLSDELRIEASAEHSQEELILILRFD